MKPKKNKTNKNHKHSGVYQQSQMVLLCKYQQLFVLKVGGGTGIFTNFNLAWGRVGTALQRTSQMPRATFVGFYPYHPCVFDKETEGNT